MTDIKTKEFMLEMKVLCKVHHTNLVMHFAFEASPVLISLELIATVRHSKALFWFYFVKVELIGYAASVDELFLIYEYAQKGSLKSHLHDPQNKGKLQFHS